MLLVLGKSWIVDHVEHTEVVVLIPGDLVDRGVPAGRVGGLQQGHGSVLGRDGPEVGLSHTRDDHPVGEPRCVGDRGEPEVIRVRAREVGRVLEGGPDGQEVSSGGEAGRDVDPDKVVVPGGDGVDGRGERTASTCLTRGDVVPSASVHRAFDLEDPGDRVRHLKAPIKRRLRSRELREHGHVGPADLNDPGGVQVDLLDEVVPLGVPDVDGDLRARDGVDGGDAVGVDQQGGLLGYVPVNPMDGVRRVECQKVQPRQCLSRWALLKAPGDN